MKDRPQPKTPLALYILGHESAESLWLEGTSGEHLVQLLA